MGPLEAIDTKPTAITLAWKPPPDDGGNKIQKYVLEKKPKGGRWTKVPGGWIAIIYGIVEDMKVVVYYKGGSRSAVVLQVNGSSD